MPPDVTDSRLDAGDTPSHGQLASDTAAALETPMTRLKIFIINASHNLTNHSGNGDGLVAWGYISELARAGHRIYALTDKLDVRGEVPTNLTLFEVPRRFRNGFLHYGSYMLAARRLYRNVAATDGVDVVHQMNPVIRGISLALFGTKVPIVLGTYVGDWKRLRSHPKYRPRTAKEHVTRVFKLAVDALQQSQAAVLMLATPSALSRVPLALMLKKRIRFLHHGVDCELFCTRPQSGDPLPRPFSILFLGHIRYIKGVLTLIEAFRHVVAEIPQARLIFVGSGLAPEVKTFLESWGLAHHAEFVGQSSRSEVAGWLRACTVLCAPSFGEPYGQNVLEAMASGKPVVATSEGGHPYLLDASGGFRVTPGDITALTQALLSVLRDPALAQRMGAHNRTIVESRNAWPLVASQLEQIYYTVIERRAHRTVSSAHSHDPRNR